jgi:hypothetical protein
MHEHADPWRGNVDRSIEVAIVLCRASYPVEVARILCEIDHRATFTAGALGGIHVPAPVTRATAAERLQGVLRPMVLKERNDRLQWRPSPEGG